jgi:hypothetical protein
MEAELSDDAVALAIELVFPRADQPPQGCL